MLRTALQLIIMTGVFLPAMTQAEEYRLLRFRATWCAPCQQQKAIFKQYHIGNSLQNLGVKDVYIDTDDHPAATKRWGVDSIPCTILVSVDENNRATTVRRWDKGVMRGPTYARFADPSSDMPKQN